jgi:hypothetical protein
MSWGGQVRIVFAKDVRQHWWIFALLAGVLLFTILRATAAQPSFGSSIGSYDVFIPLLMIVIVATAVRGDPPAVSTAFWSTQPLETSAVAAAKLVQAALITMAAIASATVVVRWWGVSWGSVLPMIALTAIGAISVAISAALLAALGKEARGMLLGVLTATGIFLAVRTYLPASTRWQTSTWELPVWVSVIAMDVAVLLQLYRLRDLNRSSRMGAAVLVAVTLLSALSAMKPSPPLQRPGARAPQLALTVGSSFPESYGFGVTVDVPDSYAEVFTLLDPTLRIDLPDGSSHALPIVDMPRSSRPATRPVPRRGTASASDSSPLRFTILSGSLTRTMRSRLQATGARVTLEGTLIEYVRREVRRMPLISGVLPSGGENARQQLKMAAGDSVMLALFTSRVFHARNAGPSRVNDFDSQDLKFHVVERATGVVVADLESSWFVSGGWKVLPGIEFTDLRWEVYRPKAAELHDMAWWAKHDLHITNGIPSRITRIHAETVVGR